MTVLVALAVLAAQSVSVTDCCCGSLCRRKNECRGCQDGRSCGGARARRSCCDGKKRQACSHLEPSTEIEPSSPPDAVVPPPLVLPLVEVETPRPLAPAGRPESDGPDPPPRRHLLLSVLLI